MYVFVSLRNNCIKNIQYDYYYLKDKVSSYNINK